MGVIVRRLAATFVTSFVCVATIAALESDIRLVDAVKARDRETAQSLLHEKVDVNTTQPDGSSALAWAAHWDDLKTVDILIRAGADANIARESQPVECALCFE